MNRKFETEHQGKKLTLIAKKPDQRALREASKAHNRAFREAVDSGAMLRPSIEKVMRQQKVWDDERQKEYDELQAKVRNGEKFLLSGKKKLSEGRKVAFEVQDARAKLRALMREWNQLDLLTAEAQAENARFSHLVSTCVVTDDNKPFFKDHDDYLARQEEPATIVAAGEFGKLFYGLDDDWQNKLPENAFLVKYKMADEKLRLLSPEGKFVSRDGRPVNEEGYLVNDKGELVDSEGTPLTKEGEYKIEFEEFEDDWSAKPKEVPSPVPALA